MNSHGGLNPSEVGSLSDRLRSLLVKTNAFDVVDRGQMEEILKEQGFQMSGCTSAECAVEAGQILGVEEMITGSIGKIGRLYTIDIILIDVETSKIIKSITRDYQGEIEGLVSLMQSITNELSSLQKAQTNTVKGGIYISSQPNNSDVYIDGKKVGNTPLSLNSISAGEHQVKIQKAGYAPSESRITIDPDKINSYGAELKKIFTVIITSQPSEAEIFVNGKRIGLTPYRASGIEDTRFDLVLRKEKFKPWVKSFTLNGDIDINAKMEYSSGGDGLAGREKDSDVKKEGGGSIWWWLGGGAVVAATAAYFLIPGNEKSDGDNSTSGFPEPPGRP
ncbi:MAG: PEGA domain-containing protein [Calditrichaceae bacterium]